MNVKELKLIAVGWLLMVFAANVPAQQAKTGSTETLEALRATVSKLRAIDRDLNTPADIRAINREFLIEKESQLRPLLQAKREEWRNYLSGNVGSLSTEQILRVQMIIRNLDTELRQLGAEAQPVTARAAPAPRPVASPEPTATPEADSTPADRPDEQEDAPGAADAQPSPAPSTQLSPTPSPQPSQTPKPTNLDIELEDSARAIRAQRAIDANSALAGFDFRRDIDLVALKLIEQKIESKGVPEAVADAENARTDKQIGGNEAQNGTTSLVSKGGVPAILGFAVENGALTRTDSGTTITFRLNPVGLVDALAQRGFITSYQTDDSFERFLRNFALGFSFDASRGNTGGVFTGSSQQLSGFSVRYNIVNRRDPRHHRYTQAFIDLARTRGVPIARNYAQLIRQLFIGPTSVPAVEAWDRETDGVLRQAPVGEERRVLQEQLNKFPIGELPPTIDVTIESLAKNLAGFREAREQLLRRVASALIMTLEYNNERRVGLPDLSNLRFIAEKGPFDAIVGVLAFIFLIVSREPGILEALPKIPEGFLYLMGVSSFGYLGGKLARKPGPVITQIVASVSSLSLEIHGKTLSPDATFRIDDVDVLPNQLDRSIHPNGRPKVEVPDEQTEYAKVLRLVIKEFSSEWLEGEHKLVLSNPDGQRAEWPFEVTTSQSPSTPGQQSPTITSIDPKFGSPDGGEPVTISGTNFLDGATVTFGRVPAQSVKVVSAASITVVTPTDQKEGTVDVVVKNADGASATAPGGFTYTKDVG